MFRAVLRGVNRRACSRTCICGVNRPPMHAVAVATTRGHFGLHVTFLRCPLDWHISKLSVPVIYISAANQKNRAYYVQARLQQPNMAACATMVAWTRDQNRDEGPGTKDQDQGPGTRDQGTGRRHQGPRTKQEPRTRDQGPGTTDQEPGTRDQGPPRRFFLT